MGYMLQVIGSPGSAFRSMRERGGAGWLLALLVLTAVSFGMVLVQWPLIEQEMLNQVARQDNPVPEDQMDFMLTFAKISGWVTAAAMPAFSAFVGGLLLLLLKLIVRGEGSYIQLVKVSLYAQVPGMIGAVLTTVLLQAFGAQSMQDVVLTGGAFFAEKTGFAYTLVSALTNPFGWWGLAVTVIGASVMMKKPARSVAAWIVTVWVVFQVVVSLTALAGQ